MSTFSSRSLDHLSTCHPDLIALFTEVVKTYDCSVICGHRDEADQEAAFNKGNSKVHFPNSKHNGLPSDAADVMPYPIKWDDIAGQHDFATYVFNTAMKMGIRVQWGGQFKSFYDAPHWQIIKD